MLSRVYLLGKLTVATAEPWKPILNYHCAAHPVLVWGE